MTDDDDRELRDDFGAEIAAALDARADAAPVADLAAAVEHRAGRRRARRRALAGIAAVVVAAVVTVTGLIATRDHTTKRVSVETPATTTAAPSTTTTTTIAVRAGYRVVSYHGVHVEVPSGWPVEDGMQTGLCYGPFGDVKTVYLGPNDNGPPSCPYVPPDPKRDARDGVWMYAQAPATDARAITTPGGQTALEENSGVVDNFVRQVWFHDVSVEIGLGPDPRVSKAILTSLGFTPGTPDTPAADVCARIDHPDAMPTPERLTEHMVLQNGDITLDPPAPTDHAVTAPEEVWNQQGERPNFEHYRLVLARYSAKFPATVHPNGTTTPDDQNELTWVVLSAPNSPKIDGCGFWGVDVTNAVTGKGIGSSGYSPGP